MITIKTFIICTGDNLIKKERSIENIFHKKKYFHKINFKRWNNNFFKTFLTTYLMKILFHIKVESSKHISISKLIFFQNIF